MPAKCAWRRHPGAGRGGFEAAPVATAPSSGPPTQSLGAAMRHGSAASAPHPAVDAAGLEEPATLSPVGAQAAKRFHRGNLVIPAGRLPEIAPDRPPRRGARYLAAAARASTVEARRARCRNAGRDRRPEFAAAFAPGARAESAIVADLPEIGEGARVNGRIDRLAVGRDGNPRRRFQDQPAAAGAPRGRGARLCAPDGALSRRARENISRPANRLRAGLDRRSRR